MQYNTKLLSILKTNKMTITSFAKEVGVSRVHMQKIVTGEQVGSLKLINKISDHLKKDVY